jgi:hypothetical protein
LRSLESFSECLLAIVIDKFIKTLSYAFTNKPGKLIWCIPICSANDRSERSGSSMVYVSP